MAFRAGPVAVRALGLCCSDGHSAVLFVSIPETPDGSFWRHRIGRVWYPVSESSFSGQNLRSVE